MNMQCLGEVAMVCLFAMKLREESYDNEADKYGLSLRQAAEASVAEALREHPPEVQKAMVGLVYLMITSWNDTEMWATSIVALRITPSDVLATVSSADGSKEPDVHASMVDDGRGFAYVRNCA